ncbi:MAG: hypothetical protein CMI14_05440 [Oleispira sp.]|jgi:2-polyprenyl-3-methyl-5-hydroxy-6-metoxy-1,4-benzoquinol methylase|nr:hypothetical protein [Oleispira sp.]|tara:strand:+ start:649 stop:2748 length:2100 start_codon:yes stop_codon:yes gene_type:complete
MNLLHASNTRKPDHLDIDSYAQLVQEATQEFSALQSNKLSASANNELLESALHKVQHALEINATGIKGLNLLARIELFRDQPHQAYAIIKRALHAKPDSPTALYSAGHIALALGQLEKAEQHFSASLKISKVATRSASSLAYTYLEQGKYVEAFQLYQELIKTQANDPHIRNKLFESASHINADFYSQELEANLLRYLNFENVDHSLLRNLITTLLHHKFQINQASTPLEFDQIAADPLLLGSLKRFYFCDSLLERLFISLRQTLLFDTVQDMTLPSAHINLAHDMAVQAQLNEYVWPVTKDEEKIIDGLGDLLLKVTQESQWQLEDIAPALLILAQYQDLSKSKLAPALASAQVKQASKSSYLADIIDYAIINREAEIQLAETIPYWEPMNTHRNKVSIKVQSQYEENPYPRWKDIGFNTASSYQQALLKNFPELNLSHWQGKQKLNVLVAGCGTGRQAIRLASYFNDLNIIAIDLSGRSLAYAKQQADKYKVNNIKFIQADILEFNNFPMLFDVIECSGVLHHMENPEQGLKSLNALLSPTGVMKIALYSKAARKQVITFRKLIAESTQQKEQGGSTTLDQRLLRQALLMKQIPGDWSDIVNSPDFYSMSNCRDLIFHEQEHQFTPNKISELLANNQLDFIGMLPTTSARQIFEKEIGKLINNNTLENWDKVEKKEDEIFAGMYQFYCRKQSNIEFL